MCHLGLRWSGKVLWKSKVVRRNNVLEVPCRAPPSVHTPKSGKFGWRHKNKRKASEYSHVEDATAMEGAEKEGIQYKMTSEREKR